MARIEAQVGANVRAARQGLRMSMRELARQSGLSYTAIWKIETGRMVPSIVVFQRVARALDKKIPELLQPLVEEGNAVYTRRQSAVWTRFKASRGRMRVLSASSHDWVVQAGEYVLTARASSGREPMAHHGEELVYCLEGKVRYDIDNQAYDLEPGDAIHFRSHLGHSFRNIHDGVSRLLVMVVPPRRRVGYRTNNGVVDENVQPPKGL